MVTFVNYTLSSYPDESWYRPAFDDAYRRSLADYSFAHWKEHPPMLKGQLALTLKRMGRPADAKLVWDSVMDSAKTDRDLGTFWAPEDRSWLWYNDTIETQAFALRTLDELAPSDPRRAGLVQWLFLNKKLNQWKSTRATAEVIYSVAHYLKKEGALGHPRGRDGRRRWTEDRRSSSSPTATPERRTRSSSRATSSIRGRSPRSSSRRRARASPSPRRRGTSRPRSSRGGPGRFLRGLAQVLQARGDFGRASS